MDKQNIDHVKTYKPRPTKGWIWLVFLATICLGVMVVPTVQAGKTLPAPIFWLVIGLGSVLFVSGYALALWFPSMRYELRGNILRLRYGPVLDYQIPLSEIKSVKRCDLGLTIWSSIRFPGIALFRVPTGNMGEVRMCSTAAMKNILLIETGSAKYGITPNEEGQFIADLKSGMEK